MKFTIFSYEFALLMMMSLANGVVAMDRTAVNALSPFIVKEFHLTNTQLGLLASGLSVAVAASGFALARLADASGRRKSILLITLVLFSLLSAVSGLAMSFAFLLGARVVLGLAEGPICAIGQSIVAIESAPQRRGFNMGFMQNFGACVVGMMAGPILFTQIGAHAGWRNAFFVSCLPGLIVAGFILFFARTPRAPITADPTVSVMEEAAHDSSFWSVFKSRNLLICLAISGLFSGWMLIQGAFLPLYLTKMDGMSPQTMGLLIGLTGPAGAISGIYVPALSDRIGRKPAIFGLTLVGVLMPLAVLFIHGPVWLLFAALFLGSAGVGAGSLYVGVIPAEAVARKHTATAVAMSLASGELIGGVLGPFVAGRAADAYGLAAPFWISGAAAATCAVLSLFLKETAPRKLKVVVAYDAAGFETGDVRLAR